jgi:nucleotide-binding universal stress UspA family protein
MKKVLIALDYDPTAQKVAEIGFSMAKNMNAEVTLLHVISDPEHYASTKHITIMGFAGCIEDVPLKLDSIDDRKNLAQKFLERSKEHLGDNNILTRVEEGDFAGSILKAANDLHADIIVMGSHSRKWLQNIVIGSVSEKVLHHTSIPVFVIPTKQNK